MKIGILGTRGIPNHYGGFEQFAEYLSVGLVEKGHQVWVYNSSSHPYQDSMWNKVNLIHCKDPEDKMGTVGQFIYDLNCIRDAKHRDFDILLQLGYTSSSVWAKWLPKKAAILTNMDGLEWKRSKYNSWVKKFLKIAEKWAIHSSDVLIADSIGIQAYIQEAYQKPSVYIPYGTHIPEKFDSATLKKYRVEPENYHMLIARMEPENNIEMILDGYVKSMSDKPFLVVGSTGTPFGKHLVEKFKSVGLIRFIGGVYDSDELDDLRYFSHLYFHGHSVGGTNPSLLEAMGTQARIAAHNNPFNRAILQDQAFYFSSPEEVAEVVGNALNKTNGVQWKAQNLSKVRADFNWPRIVDQYLELFENQLESASNESV